MKAAEEKAKSQSAEDMGSLQKNLLAKDAELCKIRQEINELKKENTVRCTYVRSCSMQRHCKTKYAG